MKLHEEQETGWGAMLLLTVLVVMALGFEVKAAPVEEISPAQQVLPLGPGSLIEINDELDFSLAREKRFCEGQDVGFNRSLMSEDCCVLRVHSASLSDRAQIILKKGLRNVEAVSQEADKVLLQSKYPLSLSCQDKAPTVKSLEKAMGTRIVVHKLIAATLPEKKAEENTDPRVMVKNANSMMARAELPADAGSEAPDQQNPNALQIEFQGDDSSASKGLDEI